MSEQESADMVEDGYTQLKPQLASHLLVPVFLLIILAFFSVCLECLGHYHHHHHSGIIHHQ